MLDSRFFVLRTPLLSFEELGCIAAASQVHCRTAEEWTGEVERLRLGLRTIVDRPEILHALYVASPSLVSGLAYWKENADSKKGRQAERALVRYLIRMCTRCTPFGLFSGCTVGVLDSTAETQVLLGPRQSNRTSTRLDFEYLFNLTRHLRRNPAVAQYLRYHPNPSLHRIGDGWHYTEQRLAGNTRTQHLVKLENDSYLALAIHHAEFGTTIDELISGLQTASADADISHEDALLYVQELVDSQVLVPDLTPAVTGPPALDSFIADLADLPSCETAAKVLKWCRDEMAVLDSDGIGVPPDRYQRIASRLESLGISPELHRLCQVDLHKPAATAVLGGAVLEEIINGVKVLCRFGGGPEPEPLRQFRDAFVDRFSDAAVPLLIALDEDLGVPFASGSAGTSPLLQGLGFGTPAERGGERHDEIYNVLQERVLPRSPGDDYGTPITLSNVSAADEVSKILPTSFSVNASIATASISALQAGDFQVYVSGIVGPSGARLLGRFCHSDPEMEMHVRAHLMVEQEADPDVIYAEIAFLPEERIGNVLCRPALREYEIVYFGKSGVPAHRQIPVSDLLIYVKGGRIRLYSQRLAREIVPRLSNAHGFANVKLDPVYRLLCYLQHQGRTTPAFSWGQMGMLDYLPRVQVGRVILQLAQWRLQHREIQSITKHEGFAQFEAIQELRSRRRLPRWVVLEEFDNTLATDLDNPVMVDAFAHTLKRSRTARLRELFPQPDQLWVAGPEGHFYHEVNVPFILRAPVERPSSRDHSTSHTPAAVSVGNPQRICPPGSEWLYLKVYGGESSLDHVLTTALAHVIETTRRSGHDFRWFFLRYSDPQTHLRIRFKGDAGVRALLLDTITQVFSPLLEGGQISRIQFDTYIREIERYGGAEGTESAEHAFCADSDCVLRILLSLKGDEGVDERWRITLLGVDSMLTDMRFDASQKLALALQLRDTFSKEFRISSASRKLIGERFRRERTKLERMLGGAAGDTAGIAAARAAFEQRSSLLQSVFATLRACEVQGTLKASISEIAIALTHLHINRLIRSSPRAHEVVLYDFLCRIYEGRIAKAAAAGSIRDHFVASNWGGRQC